MMDERTQIAAMMMAAMVGSDSWINALGWEVPDPSKRLSFATKVAVGTAEALIAELKGDGE